MTAFFDAIYREIDNAAEHVAQIARASMSFRLHVARSAYNAAAQSTPMSDPAKRKLRRLAAKKRNSFSAMLLSIPPFHPHNTISVLPTD
jgi:hypothetical protein